jgi:hypothetical protein
MIDDTDLKGIVNFLSCNQCLGDEARFGASGTTPATDGQLHLAHQTSFPGI